MNIVALIAVDPAKSLDPFFAARAELLFGIPASLIILGALVKFAGPAVKKAFADRTARIQAEIDASDADRTSAEAEATHIRQAKGDIEAERARILAEADAQAAAVLDEGRKRIALEIADAEAKADADIAAAASRGSDELRAEIARLSEGVVDQVAAATIDRALQNDLVEAFIAKVGASS
jgi:F-type H+-transporting ATPase subunit b